MQRSAASAKGYELERRFAIFLLQHGYEVRTPSGHTTWDLEVVTSSHILRVQVKAGYWSGASWQHKLSKANNIDGVRGAQAYSQSDFDCLAFNGPDSDLYMVPIGQIHLSNRTRVSLPTTTSDLHTRYSSYRINDNS